MYGTDHMEPPPDTSKAIAYADKNLAGHARDPFDPSEVRRGRPGGSSRKDKLDLPDRHRRVARLQTHAPAAGRALHPHVDQTAQPCQ